MKMLSSRWVRRIAIGAVALLAAGFAVGSLDRSPRLSQTGAHVAQRSGDGGGTAFLSGGNVEARSAAATGTYDATIGQPAPAPDSPSALPPLPDRIVKSGDLSIEVNANRFEDAWSRASSIANRFGGYVASSNRGSNDASGAAREGDRVRSGDLMIRVPSARFDAAMAELRKVGRVLGDNISSQDVTQEFTDLESRLRNLKAQEAVLLRLMASAKTVQDTLVVQERMSAVQGEIEQIQGRLKVLRSQTEMSSIAVHLAEPGALRILSDEPGPSFADAWDTAVEGLVRIGTVVMIAGIWLAPFAILAAALAALLRRRTPVLPEQS